MANLLSQNIGTNYKSILNLDATTINTPLDATLRAVTDGMGTSSPLQLSTTKVAIGTILYFNGITSAFPSIKRNGAAIDFRLADDSGACNIGASNITALAGIAAYSTIEGYSSSQAGSFTGAVRVGSAGSNTASAILDVVSTTKGFLPPRMTSTQKNAIATPATGLVVFDTTLAKLAVYTGAGWETVTSL